MSDGTDARAALAHEETAGAVGAATGGVTPKEGTELIDTTLQQAGEVHERFRHLVSGITQVRNVRTSDAPIPIPLPPVDPLAFDLMEMHAWRGPIGEQEVHYVVHAFDLFTGEQVEMGEQTVDWLAAETAGMTDYARAKWIQSRPNTFVVNERHLFVSGGTWVRREQPDGSSVAVSWDRVLREQCIAERESQAQVDAVWINENASLIESLKPSWAVGAEVILLRETDDSIYIITFELEVGTCSVRQEFNVPEGDTNEWTSEGPVVAFYGEADAISMNIARPLVADMQRAINILVDAGAWPR